MNVQRFPCRWCHVPTVGVDTYVICADCLDELNKGSHDRTFYGDDLRSAPIDGDVEARLRKLLNDW